MSRVFSVMTALIATAALVLSIIAVARTPVASPTSLGPLAGIYVSGSLDQPHYFVTLHEQGDQVHGALGFVYQDGQTSVVFTFTALVSVGQVSGTWGDGGGDDAVHGDDTERSLIENSVVNLGLLRFDVTRLWRVR